MTDRSVTRITMTPQNGNPTRGIVKAYLIAPRPSRRQRFVAWLRRTVR